MYMCTKVFTSWVGGAPPWPEEPPFLDVGGGGDDAIFETTDYNNTWQSKSLFVRSVREEMNYLGGEKAHNTTAVCHKKGFFLLVFILEGRVRVNSCVLSSSEKSYTRRYKEEEEAV